MLNINATVTTNATTAAGSEAIAEAMQDYSEQLQDNKQRIRSRQSRMGHLIDQQISVMQSQLAAMKKNSLVGKILGCISQIAQILPILMPVLGKLINEAIQRAISFTQLFLPWGERVQEKNAEIAMLAGEEKKAGMALGRDQQQAAEVDASREKTLAILEKAQNNLQEAHAKIFA